MYSHLYRLYGSSIRTGETKNNVHPVCCCCCCFPSPAFDLCFFFYFVLYIFKRNERKKEEWFFSFAWIWFSSSSWNSFRTLERLFVYINCVSVRDFLLALCISFFKCSRALEWCQGRYQQKELEEEEDLDGVFHSSTRKLLLSVVVETIK